MSSSPADDAEAAPPVRRWPAALVVVVVLAGLGLGGGAALLLGGDDEAPPADTEVRLAIGSQLGLEPEATACVVDHLRAAGALDGDLAERLVDDAVNGTRTADDDLDAAVVACGSDRIAAGLDAAGVPEVLQACTIATLADRSGTVQDAAAEAPLAVGSESRAAVSACALEHLATAVEDGAGLDAVDASCVAAEVLDRLDLETVLASIGALAVTAEVSAAATAAAETCAAG